VVRTLFILAELVFFGTERAVTNHYGRIYYLAGFDIYRAVTEANLITVPPSPDGGVESV